MILYAVLVNNYVGHLEADASIVFREVDFNARPVRETYNYTIAYGCIL